MVTIKFVYVIPWLAVQFGINYTRKVSNFTRKVSNFTRLRLVKLQTLLMQLISLTIHTLNTYMIIASSCIFYAR